MEAENMAVSNANESEVSNANESEVSNANESEVSNANESEVLDGGELDAPEADETPIQKKARRILAARLPLLSEKGLSFEKRTGSFFKQVAVIEKDEKGNVILEMGEPKKKLSRLVQTIEEETTGKLLPEFEPLHREIEIKRFAALVLDFERQQERIKAAAKELQKKLGALLNQLQDNEANFETACQLVENFELPEKEARETLTVKVTVLNEKVEKMRAMLLAAGFSEEEIAAQLG